MLPDIWKVLHSFVLRNVISPIPLIIFSEGKNIQSLSCSIIIFFHAILRTKHHSEVMTTECPLPVQIEI